MSKNARSSSKAKAATNPRGSSKPKATPTSKPPVKAKATVTNLKSSPNTTKSSPQQKTTGAKSSLAAAHQKTPQQKSTGPVWWFLLATMIICIACVAFAIYASGNLTTSKIAEKRFADYSREYYENLLWPNLKDLVENNDDKTWESYSEHGTTMVRLRQILNWKSSTDPSLDPYADFRKEGYICNEDTSNVIFHPVAPYGKSDFTATYSLLCGRK